MRFACRRRQDRYPPGLRLLVAVPAIFGLFDDGAKPLEGDALEELRLEEVEQLLGFASRDFPFVALLPLLRRRALRDDLDVLRLDLCLEFLRLRRQGVNALFQLADVDLGEPGAGLVGIGARQRRSAPAPAASGQSGHGTCRRRRRRSSRRPRDIAHSRVDYASKAGSDIDRGRQVTDIRRVRGSASAAGPCAWRRGVAQLAPEEGFEPPTQRLTAACSTTELLRKRYWRRGPDSNRCTRLCRPLRSHSATAPRRKSAQLARRGPARRRRKLKTASCSGQDCPARICQHRRATAVANLAVELCLCRSARPVYSSRRALRSSRGRHGLRRCPLQDDSESDSHQPGDRCR